MNYLVKFVTSPWFAWFQVSSCLIAFTGFMVQRQFSMAWVWLCYALANIGWVVLAGGFK